MRVEATDSCMHDKVARRLITAYDAPAHPSTESFLARLLPISNGTEMNVFIS